MAVRGALSRIGVPAWGFIDRHGTVALPPTYDAIGEFSEGLCAVQQDDLYGFIDASFTAVVEPRFHEAGDFHEGLAPVGLDGQAGYCDRSGARRRGNRPRADQQLERVAEGELLAARGLPRGLYDPPEARRRQLHTAALQPFGPALAELPTHPAIVHTGWLRIDP